jgi:hypothetical protein
VALEQTWRESLNLLKCKAKVISVNAGSSNVEASPSLITDELSKVATRGEVGIDIGGVGGSGI